MSNLIFFSRKSFGTFAFLLFSLPLFAQDKINQNIYLDSFFVADLQEAAGTELNGVLVVGDTIFVENNLHFFGLSIVFICNHFESMGKSITILPVLKGSNEFSTDKKGIAGSIVRIITKSNLEGSFIISGGNGGNGNNGTQGKSGQKPSNVNECCNQKHKGQPGRNGGTGGDGGNGGNVTLLTTSSQDVAKIQIKALGGEGGAGGLGGKGGITYAKKHTEGQTFPKVFFINEASEKNGISGSKGKQGKIGTLTLKKLTDTTFVQELSTYGIDNFKSSEIPFATLININKDKPEAIRPKVFPVNPINGRHRGN